MGTSDYAHLPPVPAVANSLQRMADMLTGPLCEWPRERLLILLNERDLGVLPDKLITAFEDITDVALFYYVGHGQIDLDDQLCLGLVGSRPEPNRRAATSLSFQTVRRALLDSKAATKIVILDCCFAGLASRPVNTLAGNAGEVLDMAAGTGAYTLAASGAYTTAWYESDPQVSRPQTFFTRYLADLVEGGIRGEAPRLRLHSLFTSLKDTLERDGRPVPRERSVDAARDFVFAHNAAPPETHRDIDLELRLLNQRLAEAEDKRSRERAAAEAREQALRAEASRLAQELERLREQERHSQTLDPVQQQELHNAIKATEHRLDETTAAEAAAITEGPGTVSAAMPHEIAGPSVIRHSAQQAAGSSAEQQATRAIPVVSGDSIGPGSAQRPAGEQARRESRPAPGIRWHYQPVAGSEQQQQQQPPPRPKWHYQPTAGSEQQHPPRPKGIAKSWVPWATVAIAILVLTFITIITLSGGSSPRGPSSGGAGPTLRMGQSANVTSGQTGGVGAAIVTLSGGQTTTHKIGTRAPAHGYYVVVHVKATATADGFTFDTSEFYAKVNGQNYDTNSGNEPTYSLPNQLNIKAPPSLNKNQSASGDIAFDIPARHGTIAFTPGNADSPVAYWSF